MLNTIAGTRHNYPRTRLNMQIVINCKIQDYKIDKSKQISQPKKSI